jgi:hypothetical protein
MLDDNLAMNVQSLVHVKETSFIWSIMVAYSTPKAYPTEKKYLWLQNLGDELIQSTCSIVTVTNLEDITGNQHWVALILSSGGAALYYGDLLHQPIPPRLVSGLTWWIQEYHGALHPVTISLPTITRQQDNHSCGIYAVTALVDFLVAQRTWRWLVENRVEEQMRSLNGCRFFNQILRKP